MLCRVRRRPVPTRVYHFSHIDHLGSIVADGLLADSAVAGSERLTVEIGQRSIKAQRRQRRVPCHPGGVVADYVPFYFAPRSPMLYAVQAGRVPEYQAGQEPLAYLVTSVERLVGSGLRPVFTDRNAALALARFTGDVTELEELVDWELMEARYWVNTPDEPDRRERRMAECLVAGRVPWDAFEEVGVISPQRRLQVERLLRVAGAPLRVLSHPEWYF